mmetsp:Transcript_42495/g.40743  ORF Transcript_42495/g.40743 Transcript_42495/m.40743 type:complete len:662 (+) Transcript_42495:374-2359(+)
MQIEEMSNSLKQNVVDLRKMIDNTKRLIDENSKLVEQVQEELQRLMDQQLSNIHAGFEELFRKLEEKRHEIIIEFEKKYKKETQRFITKQNLIAVNSEEVVNIEGIFDELVQFLESSNDAQVLQKISEITTFLYKSFTDLDLITKNQVTQKGEIYIDTNFKPLSLNVRKAMEIVKKFEMIWPSMDQKNQFKVFGMQDGDSRMYKAGHRSQELSNQDEIDSHRRNQETFEDGYSTISQQKPGRSTDEGTPQKKKLASSAGIPKSILSKSKIPAPKVGSKSRKGEKGSFMKGPSGDDSFIGSAKIANVKIAEPEPDQIYYKKGKKTKVSNINVGDNQSEIKSEKQLDSDVKLMDEVVDETFDTNKIYCFGDNQLLLQFNVGAMQWWSMAFENNSAYDGSLKYMSSCAVDKKIFLTGGCFVSNGYPSSICFEMQTRSLTQPVKKKNMLMKRYAHVSLYLNGFLYCLGGFSHKDLLNEVPATLGSCEKYSVLDNQWAYLATMNESRAFSSAVALENQFIYVFGGLHDLQVLSTIEKYDSVCDSWVSVYFKLPIPLAKHGAAVIDNHSVLICGGMSSEMDHPVHDVYCLDLQKIKWSKRASMLSGRIIPRGGLAYSNGFVFAFGGNPDGICERYNFARNKWQKIPSYAGKINGENNLYNFTLCLSK